MELGIPASSPLEVSRLPVVGPPAYSTAILGLGRGLGMPRI